MLRQQREHGSLADEREVEVNVGRKLDSSGARSEAGKGERRDEGIPRP